MNRIAAFVIATVASGLLASSATLPAQAASTATTPPDSPAAALARLDQLNNQVDQANGRLDAANRKLAKDQAAEKSLDDQIAAIARMQYKQPSLIIQLFGAGSLSQLLGDISSDQLMASKERNLLLQARELRRQDQQARDQASASLASVQKARDAAKKVADDALASAALRARAAAVVSAPAVTAAKWSGQGPWPNHFTYGYCTWYVANRRYVPWFGNAIDWWPNARPYGYAEGATPRVGAIMVTRESGYGHVAYVEAVYSDGSWMVSEMNFTGWDQVDRRTIHPGQVPLVGFIY